ncbi:MAG: cell envelope integrity protein TolA [Verrucomicrobia bacterium]|nr:cell envelope integrity protein TolA [Verrucomicrobiota bacterium]
MTARSPSAFMLSATLHAFAVALVFLIGFIAQRNVREPMKVFELVAGEGDNYGAKVAPALGTPGGVKLDLPAPPAPRPVPVAPAPVPPAPKAAEPTVPNFARQIRKEVIRAESKAKAAVAKERAAEAKRLAEEQKRMTKEEFDRANKAAKATPNAAPPKVARIDAEGIAKGMVGGSSANKVGGAGGKALVSDHDDVLAAYFSMFKQRLRAAFEAPPGLSDNLVALVRVQSNADGSLTGARIVTGSGSAEFDRAVLEAVRRTRMPARPDGKSESIDFPFVMRERDDG